MRISVFGLLRLSSLGIGLLSIDLIHLEGFPQSISMKAVTPDREDVPGIVRLVEFYSLTGIVIKRPPEEIIKNINYFRVVKIGGNLAGCVSLHFYSQDLAELRTLVVAPAYQGRGIGTCLVETVKAWAQDLKVKKLFTLTEKVDFFRNRGFHEVGMNKLPEKIFKDCQYCRFQNDCRETALWIVSD